MDFKKWLLSLGVVACFGLAACNSSSSGSDDEGGSSSSSSGAIIDLPETNGDSLIMINSFLASNLNVSTLKLTGTVMAKTSLDTSVVLDSVRFHIGNSDGIELSSARFTVNSDGFVAGTVQSLSIGKVFSPTLDLTSFEDCGTLRAYVVVYASNAAKTKIVARDSAEFNKPCVEVASSSSAAVTDDPSLTAWSVTLSTTATQYKGVDLDSKAQFLSSELETNKELVDLYLERENASAVLYTNANLDAAEGSTIGEENKSAANYADFPDPAYMSDFGYSESAQTISASDFGTISAYVVITSSFNASTGKGFFVVLPHSPVTAGNDVSLELTVLGNWN